MIRLILAASMALLFSSCRPQKEPRYLLLVSFDGFRFDYLEKFDAPNFREFVNEGVAAEGLIPAYPSKTFPNHYTLVTGLAPGHHGIVDNSFYDVKSERRYGMNDTSAVRDAYFYKGVPIWNVAQANGMKSACLFWVGSEAAIGGQRPDYYLPYDESMPERARVDQVMEWFRLPKDKRPNFVSLYFEVVDTQTHDFGTESPEAAAAVEQADAILGYLAEQLSKLPFEVNVVVVSDHGMLELRKEKKTYLVLSEILDSEPGDRVVVSSGTQVHIYGEDTDNLYADLKGREHHFKVLRKSEFPEHWQYSADRVGDVLLVADKGYYFRNTPFDSTKLAADAPRVFGVHGYDPEASPEMQGIFYAKGPNVASRKTIPAFKNVHVYPFLAELLGIEPPASDGDANVLNELLRIEK